MNKVPKDKIFWHSKPSKREINDLKLLLEYFQVGIEIPVFKNRIQLQI